MNTDMVVSWSKLSDRPILCKDVRSGKYACVWKGHILPRNLTIAVFLSIHSRCYVTKSMEESLLKEVNDPFFSSLTLGGGTEKVEVSLYQLLSKFKTEIERDPKLSWEGYTYMMDNKNAVDVDFNS